MRRRWTENGAISMLNANGAEVKKKFIVIRNGLKGLSACSALDFLKNHCGYTVSLQTKR